MLIEAEKVNRALRHPHTTVIIPYILLLATAFDQTFGKHSGTDLELLTSPNSMALRRVLALR